MQEIPLSELDVGEKARIVSIGGSGAVKRRIMDMGFTTGSRIEVIRRAPMGDPIEFKIRGYRISLRKEEAENIIVRREG